MFVCVCVIWEGEGEKKRKRIFKIGAFGSIEKKRFIPFCFIYPLRFNKKGVIVLIPARPLRLWKTSLFLWPQSSYFSTLLSWHIIIIPQHPCRDKTKYVVVCTKKNGERWLSSLLSVGNLMVAYRIIPTCDHGEKEVEKKKHAYATVQ